MKNQIKKGIFSRASAGGALAFAPGLSSLLRRCDQQAGMPSTGASATEHGSGTVTAIDKGTRTVTLKTDAGEIRSFQVSSDVQGFDKLKKGDKVDVDYTESIAIAMLPKGSKLSTSDQAAATKTGEGAGAAGRQITVSAKVVSVDTTNNTVTLKGPKGNVETVEVQDPENQAKLPGLKAGQVMQFTYTGARWRCRSRRPPSSAGRFEGTGARHRTPGLGPIVDEFDGDHAAEKPRLPRRAPARRNRSAASGPEALKLRGHLPTLWAYG